MKLKDDSMLNPQKNVFNRQRHVLRNRAIAALIIIAIIYLASTVFLKTSTSILSSNQTFSIKASSAQYFKFPNNPNTYLFFVSASTNSSATIYLTSTPILSNPIVAINLAKGGSANLSSDAGQIANMHVQLTSTSPSQIILSITPISPSLGLRVSSSAYLLSSSSLNSSSASTTILTTQTTTMLSTLTTTVSSGGGGTNSTIPTLQIMTKMNSTNFGTLMANYKALFKKDTGCDSLTYNTTFQKYIKQSPTGPNSYASAQFNTSTDLIFSIANAKGGTYTVTYNALVPNKQLQGPAFVAQVNLTSGTVYGTFKGIFFGANYTQVNASYNFQYAIPNLCGAYIP